MVIRLLLLNSCLVSLIFAAPTVSVTSEEVVVSDNAINETLVVEKVKEPLDEATKLIYEDVFTDSVLTCDNETAPGQYMIYCSGKLLQAVMAVRLHADSKTFLDQPMKKKMTGQKIMSEFTKRFPGDISLLTRDQVATFVDEFFDSEGHELQSCKLNDWNPTPGSFSSISDGKYRQFAKSLHLIWADLCREMKKEVRDEPDRYSLIYVPHNFIIPGGRFREFYYWDAYWIVKGLLASELYETARNMILNFAHMIKTIGFVPNGGRVYYLRRSQPPLFAPMVYEYFLATRDSQFVSEMVPFIEKEFEFWTNRRSVNVTVGDGEETVHMFQFRTEADTPRPESFREDVLSAANLPNMAEKRRFFQNIGSAAESGWDFSSRWFADGQNIETIETSNIVPVDLNAFACYNMQILSFFYQKMGNPLKEAEWSEKYTKFRANFQKVFYVQSRRGWYDYNVASGQHNTDFYPTIAVPLFAQCYDPLDQRLVIDVYNQMESTGAFGFSGGIPTSLKKNSTQQWDFPNGWSPLNHMVIEGLRKSAHPLMQQKAFSLAEKFLLTNYKTFSQSEAMWEKYDVAEPESKLASGGEYDVQAGFGWTNGVALDLLVTYGDRLSLSTGSKDHHTLQLISSSAPAHFLGFTFLLVLFL